MNNGELRTIVKDARLIYERSLGKRDNYRVKG